MDLETASRLYEEYTYTEQNANDNKCDCINATQIPDANNYYLTCSECGICIDTVRHQIFEYSNNNVFCAHRKYTRSSYIRNILNRIFYSKKEALSQEHISKIQKKCKTITIHTIIKYVKKQQLRGVDIVKTLFLVKNKPFPSIMGEVPNIIHSFNRKELTYRQNGYTRVNYNFLLMKIFQEMNRPDLEECVAVTRNKALYQKYQDVYNDIFT